MLDLTRAFELIGKKFVMGLRRGVETQTGLDGNTYSRPEVSTLEARQGKRGGVKKGGRIKSAGNKTYGGARSTLDRMYVTHDTALRGFEYEAYVDGVKVFVSKRKHIGEKGSDRRGNPSFEQLIGWNSAGQTNVNENISVPPLIFPTNPQDILAITDGKGTIVDQAYKIVRNEVLRQASGMYPQKIVHDLR